ncbi:MAG: hypothetical protein IPG68_06880 [Micrococcales bacterium]|nr:hypothetical protein [Micrococcales bacterium]
MDAFHIPLAAGFDAHVPAEPAPGPHIRSWQWLLEHAGRQAEDYVRHLADAGLEPDFGRNRCHERWVALAAVPDDLVRAEFATQAIVLRHAGVRYRLAPVSRPVAAPCPIAAEVAFVSLTGRVEGHPTEEFRWPAPPGWRVVGAMDAALRWTDQMVAADPAAAFEQARVTDQPYLVAWRVGPGQGTLDVMEVATGTVISSRPAALTRAVLPCPLIPGAGCGQLCRLYGGPWVSRSITAAARWTANRSNRLGDVGCDTCGDGAVNVGLKVDGRYRVRAGTDGPGLIDVASGERMGLRGPDRRYDHPADNRYGRLLALEE